METYLLPVAIGIVVGFIARLILLRTDFKQYPSYPQGRIIHLSIGFIASFIGAVAVPAVLESDWTAVTFLGLAATQFRDVRKMERETLERLDSMELVKRGAPYIEGMAQAFEGRNYLVMFTSMVTVFIATIFNVWWGIAAGIVMLVIDKRYMSGKRIMHIADIIEADVQFEGPDVYVGDIHIKNVGPEKDRQVILGRAAGFIVIPKNANSVVTLAHLGQRQAMLHHASNILGVYRDSGEPALVPLSKRDLADGRIALLLFPQEKDPAQIKTVLEHVPILDSAIRLPSEAHKGKRQGNS